MKIGSLSLGVVKHHSSQVVGRSHYELFPDIPPVWKEIHRRALQDETLLAEEDRWDRVGGTTWVYCQSHISPTMQLPL
jgi:hypothetical protein